MPLAHLRIGDYADAAERLDLPESFVVSEEEQPVLLKGPPSARAELVLSEGGNEVPCVKKLRESRALLRRNSNNVPCSELVPDCVTTLTCAPARLPYSAP